jgi:hypothetical protein
MYAAITAVLMAMIKAINTVSPQIISTMFRMLTLLLLTIRNYMPILILLGTQIVVSMLNGIRNNINRIVTAAVNLIVAFINAVSQQQSKVIQAGVRLIISFVNGLADAIRSNSGAMRSAGANLAGAIIDGMTGGLASGATRLANKAASVAKGALSAAMGALGVHSPSKEFFKLGAWSVEGLANGLTQNASMADRAAAGIGNTAIDALKASISKIADVVSADMELAPTIRPVLDLSDVKKNAGTIGGLLGDKTLNIGVTSSNAKDASNGHSSNQSQPFDPDDPRFGGAPPSVSYTQNNYSPKTLSPAEIYRQTKNQLSVTKGALAP